VRAAIYARVSTDRQESMNQIAELRAFCDRKGWTIVREYVDEDIGGKQERKPRLESLLGDAHRGEFQIVAFWSLDRLTRRGPDDAADLLGRIAAAGVDFVSFKEEAINSMGPWKRILIDVLAIVANFEAQRISERTKAGLSRARANGTRLGRPPVDTKGLTLAAVAARRTAGLSWSKMSERTGITAGTLRRLAKMASPKSG